MMSALPPIATSIAFSACLLWANSGHQVSGSRRVSGEDVVAILGRLVAREACLMQCLVARFAIFEVCKTPDARCGVFLRVLDHELNILGGVGNGRLEANAGQPGGQISSTSPCAFLHFQTPMLKGPINEAV